MTVTGHLTGALPGISLADLDAVAALQTRTDRKYVVTPTLVPDLIEAFSGDVRVLDIDGRRTADYESVYFDTPDLSLFLAAARSRRRRFKVRTRLYPDEPEAVLEVKQKTSRGETVKQRHHSRVVDPRRLSDHDRDFIEEAVGRAGASEGLVPTLTTRYRRTTLVDPGSRSRLTCDEDLVCVDGGARRVSLPAVILETKSPAGPSLFDRWLWAQGHRPERISKYCVGLAVLHPDLPSNKWHRTIKRHFADLPVSQAQGGHDQC